MLDIKGREFDSPRLHQGNRMKCKNQIIHSDDEEYLRRLEDDFIFMGRNVRREDGKLTVFSIARKKKKIQTRFGR
jgi:hypothetical protein